MPQKTTQSKEKYELCLYITGSSPQSSKAVSNMKMICEKYLNGIYVLEIIDIHQQPQLAQTAQLIAVPTLIKTSPLPAKRLVGDMTDIDKVLRGLGLSF
jgi:circadian clock protein KaiB